MAAATLVAAAVFALAAGALYAFVGFKVLGRPTSPDARLAARLFAVWWFGFAATTLLGGLTNLTAALAPPSLPVFLAYTMAVLMLICVALWGLVFYLVYLFTGRRWVIYPITAFYLVYALWLAWLVVSLGPTGVEVGRWSVTLTYAQSIEGSPVATAAIALLLFPQIIGALAYSTLYFKLSDPMLRFRVAVVSTSIVVWFLSAFLANIAGLSRQDTWQVASRAIGLCAALAILIAYNPPGWLRRRLGVATAAAEEPAPPAAAAPSAPPPPRGLPFGMARDAA